MDVVSRCPLPVASVLWQPRHREWALTFVCKATYRLAPTTSELASEQEAPNEDDNYWNDDTTRSLYAPSDLVPFKARADVILVGHAFAPRREPTRSLVAQLTIGTMTKAIECFCDRSWTLDGQLREGARFIKIPLRYERAAGGPETRNPVGMRPDAVDPYGMISVPNLQPPGTPIPQRGETVEAICFGPIAPTWPSRVEKLGRYASAWFKGAWNSQPLPEDVEPGYFNCAPVDQQIASIRPTERIILENLHPEHPRLLTNLSGKSPLAFLERPGAAPEEVRLTCDTLWIDTDRALCTLVWRGRVALEHPAQAGRVVVSMEASAGARESRSDPPRAGWKEAAPPAADMKAPRPAAGRAPHHDREEFTHVTNLPDKGGGALPFVKAAAAEEEEDDTSMWSDTTAVGQEMPNTSPLPFVSAGRAAPKPALPFQPRPSQHSMPQTDPGVGAMRPPEHAAPSAPPMVAAQAPPPVPPPLVRPPPTMDPIAPPPSPASPWATQRSPGLGAPTMPGRSQPPPLPSVSPVSSFSSLSSETANKSSSFAPKYEPPISSTPSPSAAIAAATGGAAGASNAAALSARASSASLPVPAVRPAAQASPSLSRDVLMLLWFDPSFVKPISEEPRWAKILAQPDDDDAPAASEKVERVSPPDDDGDDGDSGELFDDGDDDSSAFEDEAEQEDVPPEVRDKRNVFKILARGEPSSAAGINQEVADAIGKDGTLEPPLVLVSGELVFPFDELETLKATVTAVSPLVAGDKKLKEVVDTVNELLKTPWLSRSGSVAEGLTARIKEAFAQGNRMLPPSYLESHTERILLEERHYQKRTVFGQTWIRSLLVPAFSQEPIPAYLPESLSKQLPMFQRLRTRLIAEVHMQQDQYEANPIALRVVALARVSSLAAGSGGGAKA